MGFGSQGSYNAHNEEGYTLDGYAEDAILKADHKYRISLWVQKTRLRVYLDQVKLFGLPGMRNKLLTEGKLVSYGIYFDVNKDVVKPES